MIQIWDSEATIDSRGGQWSSAEMIIEVMDQFIENKTLIAEVIYQAEMSTICGSTISHMRLCSSLRPSASRAPSSNQRVGGTVLSSSCPKCRSARHWRNPKLLHIARPAPCTAGCIRRVSMCVCVCDWVNDRQIVKRFGWKHNHLPFITRRSLSVGLLVSFLVDTFLAINVRVLFVSWTEPS